MEGLCLNGTDFCKPKKPRHSCVILNLLLGDHMWGWGWGGGRIIFRVPGLYLPQVFLVDVLLTFRSLLYLVPAATVCLPFLAPESDSPCHGLWKASLPFFLSQRLPTCRNRHLLAFFIASFPQHFLREVSYCTKLRLNDDLT